MNCNIIYILSFENKRYKGNARYKEKSTLNSLAVAIFEVGYFLDLMYNMSHKGDLLPMRNTYDMLSQGQVLPRLAFTLIPVLT